MSTSGKWLLILGIIALVSAIAFGFSVAALGVQDGNYNISMFGNNVHIMDGIYFGGATMGNTEILFRDGQTNIRYDFEQNKEYTGSFSSSDFDDIKISLASCKANVICADTDKVEVVYTTGNRPVSFTAQLNDGTLSLDEKVNIGINLFNFGSSMSSTLTLTIPETLYNSIDINLASGKIVSSGIKSDNFKANVASGTLELGMYAEDIDINIASGKMILTNCTGEKTDNINIQAASGSIEMTGFKADDTDVGLASGSVVLNGISGKVKGDLASGKLIMTYAEWDDDLHIKLLSGKADVTLPAGSGVSTSLKRLSGSMNVDLDGASVKYTNSVSGAITGGSNVHTVDGDIASGSINIHN